MKRPAGFVLVGASFLGGAFLASLDANTVNWAWFVPVVAAGFAGAWLASMAGKSEARSEKVLSANRTHIEQSLALLDEHLADLDTRKSDLSLDKLREEIDTRLRSEFDRFAEARESLTHIYGLQHYADIMNAFAAGERYVNRVWSAAADGYGDEARSYVTRAHGQITEAREKLAAAEAELKLATGPGAART